jgi:RNA polymerase sigma-70 factor (ECF subfamily)
MPEFIGRALNALRMFVPNELDGIVADDIVLMRRMAAGERNALGTLYERHAGVAFAFARRMLADADDAEEAVQDAFLALWRRAETFRPGGAAPRAWLLAIVRNRCIDQLRRRRGETNQSLEDAQASASVNELWPEIWKRHCGDVVRAALAALSPEQREVIELGFYSGLSHSQIATRLDVPLGTVKKRMRGGLKRLRLALDERYARSAT